MRSIGWQRCFGTVSVEDHARIACASFRSPDWRPNALRRALRNLIDDARRYGGSARISSEQEGETLIIRINDDGPGLPPDHLRRVFDPFERLETSRSRDTGGTGLGLSIARAIIQAHGGDVTLENRAEGGLRALMHLPTSGQRGR